VTIQANNDGPLYKELVAVIRSMSSQLGMSNAAIGRRLGVPRETIRDIVLRKTWKETEHATEDSVGDNGGL